MDVKKLTLNNIGRFNKLELFLAPSGYSYSNVTVFVGNNGSGKTTILRSLATSLSWLIAKIQSDSGKGSPIPELVIKNGQPSAAIDLDIFHQIEGKAEDGDGESNDANWFNSRIAKAKKGKKAIHKTDLHHINRLANRYRTLLSEHDDTSLPLIAFYSVERVVIDVPLKIRTRHSFTQIDGYDRSISDGVDFRRFFEWFREREDSENEMGLSDEMLEKIKSTISEDNELWSELDNLRGQYVDKQLSAVREAIGHFTGFSNLRVRRKPRLHMSVEKNGEVYDVSQLSQGEKSLMALIGDIARRLAIMNPALNKPLEGDGIVIIDEVDMHLHPKWQRSLIRKLSATFPNCQFILSTHSPLVISDSKDVLTYLIDGDVSQIQSLYGEDVNSVLLNVMGAEIRNAEIEQQLADLLDSIQIGDITKSHQLITSLENNLPFPSGNIELAKAKLLLRKKELRIAKDS